ncbi:MAG: hypothetical protein ACO3JI_05610, partial [Steroidobacteraceae bacterium]
MNSLDLVSLDDAALKARIREHVLREPCATPREDWRYGALSPERRQELRSFFPAQPTPAAVLVP